MNFEEKNTIKVFILTTFQLTEEKIYKIFEMNHFDQQLN